MLRRSIRALRRPHERYPLGVLLAAGLVAGLVAVPAFTTVIHETSTDPFCLSCHANDVGLEMAGTVHYDNTTGMRVSCYECHLPREFWPKVFRKTQVGIKDVYHTILGTIDTPEKFEAHRMHMAMDTWEYMNANDSRECRHCHDQSQWVVAQQSEKAQQYHEGPLARGKTCIDCHKGIAHKLPEGITEDHQIEGLDF